jgi:hypothetical protein
MLRAKEGSLVNRPQKITFAEMRSSGVLGLLVYCADYKCSRYIAISGDRCPMNFVCLILSQSLFARHAASWVPTCGRILNRDRPAALARDIDPAQLDWEKLLRPRRSLTGAS